MSGGRPTSTDLLPCPFCGWEAGIFGTPDTEWVSCSICHSASDVFPVGEDKAKRAWNRRVKKNVKERCVESDFMQHCADDSAESEVKG